MGAPAYYWVDEGIDFGIWQSDGIDKLWKAIILTLIGIAAVFVALHLMNGRRPSSQGNSWLAPVVTLRLFA